MSIAKAISNAMSGLTATARGTETVASNIANVMTPGYARRDMVVSAQLHGGGVRIDGITRIVNSSLLSESRLAASSVGDGATTRVVSPVYGKGHRPTRRGAFLVGCADRFPGRAQQCGDAAR